MENNYELLGIYYELFITFAKNKSDYESISNNITLFVANPKGKLNIYRNKEQNRK